MKALPKKLIAYQLHEQFFFQFYFFSFLDDLVFIRLFCWTTILGQLILCNKIKKEKKASTRNCILQFSPSISSIDGNALFKNSQLAAAYLSLNSGDNCF